jgi:hypothetical protein
LIRVHPRSSVFIRVYPCLSVFIRVYPLNPRQGSAESIQAARVDSVEAIDFSYYLIRKAPFAKLRRAGLGAPASRRQNPLDGRRISPPNRAARMAAFPGQHLAAGALADWPKNSRLLHHRNRFSKYTDRHKRIL